VLDTTVSVSYGAAHGELRGQFVSGPMSQEAIRLTAGGWRSLKASGCCLPVRIRPPSSINPGCTELLQIEI
jgi:hypothetical protein